jgi:hypothetical protein
MIADTSVDDTTRRNYMTCVAALRLLAKFLGLVTFLPYKSGVSALPEDIVGSQSAIRAKVRLLKLLVDSVVSLGDRCDT